VEEQFYLLWPLLFAFIARLRPGWRPALLTLLGAVVSGWLMAMLYWPELDPSRIHYGSDTRAAGLLAGAALAFVLPPGRAPGRLAGMPLEMLGLGAVAGLAAFCLWLSEFNPLLCQGGFALVALASCGAIAVAVHGGRRLCARLLGCPPLRWIGTRSYGIYLWHWPIFMITRPQLDVLLEGLPLLALRLAVTLVLAELSHRLVEAPAANGALSGAWRALRQARGARRWWLGLRWAGVGGTAAGMTLALGMGVAMAQPPAAPPCLARQSVRALVALNPVEDVLPTVTDRPGTPGAASAAPMGQRLLALARARATRASGVSAPTTTAVAQPVPLSSPSAAPGVRPRALPARPTMMPTPAPDEPPAGPGNLAPAATPATR